jgi:hypothetical protein
MARPVRYAPQRMGGAGFKQLYIEQGILLVQQIQKFLNSPNTTIGRLLRATISWTQAFLGTSQLFLSDTSIRLPPTQPSLLLDLRSFLQHINGTITLCNAPISKKLRENDRHIMDIVMCQTQWTPKQVIQINSCRRYLQAQTLADITTIQGTRIKPSCLDGATQPDNKTVKISLFNQSKPSTAAWKTWRRFLATICNRQAVLHNPLQRWTTAVQNLRHWPPYVYDAETDMLYSHYQGAEYYIHSRIAPGIFQVRHSDQVRVAKGYPTATVITMDTLRPQCNYVIEQTTMSFPVQVLGKTLEVELWEAELLNAVSDTPHSTLFMQHIEQDNIITCSDRYIWIHSINECGEPHS